MEKLYVSRDGLERMKADLAACMKRRAKVAAAIEHDMIFEAPRDSGNLAGSIHFEEHAGEGGLPEFTVSTIVSRAL